MLTRRRPIERPLRKLIDLRVAEVETLSNGHRLSACTHNVWIDIVGQGSYRIANLPLADVTPSHGRRGAISLSSRTEIVPRPKLFPTEGIDCPWTGEALAAVARFVPRTRR